jgi:branched-chain amino acid aminotransferase
VTDAHAVVWVDGRRLPSESPHVSGRDRGFTLADGVFETMKAYNGTIFRLDRHLSRIAGALRALAIPQPPELRDWVDAASRAAGLPRAGIRLTVTRGIAAGGVIPPIDPHPTVVVTVTPLPTFGADVYAAGLNAHVASGRRNEHSMVAGLKTLAYIESVAAMIEARRAGADEALFLDTAGHCSEATASNLFAVMGGRLTTPPTSCAALPGITRAAVLELGTECGIAVEERPFDLAELASASEAFLTSSLRGIAPLVRIDGAAVGSGTPGPITRQVMGAYAVLVDRECAA